MSHIFEALRRAEAERSGSESVNASDSVLALLEREPSSPAQPVESQPVASPQPSNEKLGGEALERVRMLTPSIAPDACLVCMTDQGSLAAERFRLLGLRLRHLRDRRQLKRILVTSAIPEEGKTFVAANLALNQSRSRILKTVLVDGDLRRRSVGRRFGLSSALPGLAECLRGEKQLSDVLCKIQNTQLWFLPAGNSPDTPLELMQSGRTSEILSALSTAFDWVIIDSPPVLPLADASFWTKLADGTLLVTREGVSDRRSLKRIWEMIDPSTVIGMVVNSSSVGDHKDYYHRYTTLSLSAPAAAIAEPFTTATSASQP